MRQYSDEIDRLMMKPERLVRLKANTDGHTESILRVRDLKDSDITGGLDAENPNQIPLLRAGLLYMFDAVDECGSLLADDVSALAGYWKTMALRRACEFGMARELSRSTGDLPFFATLLGRSSLISAEFAKQLTWDQYLMIHLCEQAAYGDSSHTDDLVAIQIEEFDTVFDYTWRQVTGSGGGDSSGQN